MLEREFHRAARGPGPRDEDVWCLTFDPAAARLMVRHEWQATGHGGVDEYTLAEFLAQGGGPAEGLIALLFERAVTA